MYAERLAERHHGVPTAREDLTTQKDDHRRSDVDVMRADMDVVMMRANMNTVMRRTYPDGGMMRADLDAVMTRADPEGKMIRVYRDGMLEVKPDLRDRDMAM